VRPQAPAQHGGDPGRPRRGRPRDPEGPPVGTAEGTQRRRHRPTVTGSSPPARRRRRAPEAVLPLIAVLSDVHGNRHALSAVLRAAVQRGASEWWCLGDLVGYGAHPRETLRTCAEEASRCLAGNHDLGASGRIPLDVFTANAFAALAWTREQLGPEGRARLDALEPADPGGPVPLFHASPRDPVWEYVLSVGQARDALERVRAPLVLVGHTHVPVAWHHGEDGAMRRVGVDAGPIPLDAGRWLVNPGSVGQPRDGDARASWALLDPEAGTIEVVRTPYDVAGAQGAILAAGLPPGLAARLSGGR